MLLKSCPVSVKAVGTDDGLQEGQFRAVVSVFGNKDSTGDVVVKGAFAETLADWAGKEQPIPVYWSHRMDDPDYNIGHVIEAQETEVGLEVLAQLDLDDDAKKARQVYRLLKGRRVTQFSFAYDVLDGEAAKSDELGDHYLLKKLRLYEVGPTPIGANQETELLAVKAATDALVRGLKTGRVLSAKNESTLREAQAQINAAAEQLASVLAAVQSTSDQEKAIQPEPVQDEEPTRAKSEGPMPSKTADAFLAVLDTFF